MYRGPTLQEKEIKEIKDYEATSRGTQKWHSFRGGGVGAMPYRGLLGKERKGSIIALGLAGSFFSVTNSKVCTLEILCSSPSKKLHDVCECVFPHLGTYS